MAAVVRASGSPATIPPGLPADGYPRNPSQARTLEVLLAGGASLDAAISLRVPQATLIRRTLGRGRQDDGEG
jgi:adenylate kinase family enzyme